MRYIKLAIFFISFFYSSLLFSHGNSVGAALSPDDYFLQSDYNNCQSNPATYGCHISSETVSGVQQWSLHYFSYPCPDGKQYNEEGNCSQCSSGEHLASINGGQQFCTSLDCGGMGGAIASTFGADSLCVDSSFDDDLPDGCPEGSAVCVFVDDSNDTNGFEPTGENGSNSNPDPNSLPDPNSPNSPDPTPDTNENTTTTTETEGDNTVTTETTTTTNNNITTITDHVTSTNNVTGVTTTTTTTTTTDNETGETTTTVTGTSDDGNGEDEDGDSASGGRTCDVAPSCSGDAIECATLYQQWETRCAIQSLEEELSGGDCDPATETCGDSITAGETCESPPIRGNDVTDSEWQTVMQNYRIRCPLTDLLNTQSENDFGTTAQDALEEKQGEYENFIDNLKLELKDSFSFNLSGSGTITDEVVSIRGTSVSFGMGKFSGQLSIIKAFFIAAAAILAFIIIMRAGSTRSD